MSFKKRLELLIWPTFSTASKITLIHYRMLWDPTIQLIKFYWNPCWLNFGRKSKFSLTCLRTCLNLKVHLMMSKVSSKMSAPLLNILSKTKSKKPNKTAFSWSQACKTFLLPWREFHKEENLIVIKKERPPMSLRARLGFQDSNGFAKRPSWITVKTLMLTIQIRIDLMHFYIHTHCSIVEHIINEEQKTAFFEPGLQGQCLPASPSILQRRKYWSSQKRKDSIVPSSSTGPSKRQRFRKKAKLNYSESIDLDDTNQNWPLCIKIIAVPVSNPQQGQLAQFFYLLTFFISTYSIYHVKRNNEIELFANGFIFYYIFFTLFYNVKIPIM